MASWDELGNLSSIVQLTGLDAVRIIGLIVTSANNARMHKRNCLQFANHLKLIGNLLEQLKISELKKYPETREPLEQLEDALRRSFVLVDSCQKRSYLYLLAMGWNIVYQFKLAQSEVDRYLKIIPLITLVDNARVRVRPFQEKLTHIEKDRCEYTFDEEDKRVQDVILNREPSVHDSAVLKKSLSCSYNMSFKKALEKESEKLQLELQRSQTNMDRGQCEMIQHLLEVTGRVAEYTPEKNTKNVELNYSYSSNEKEQQAEEISHSYHGKTYDREISRGGSSMSSTHDLISNKESEQHEEWSTDLLGCCSEPSLCMKTFCCPCATFARISSVATNRPISSSEACNDLMAYSLILSCCCYTCCIRRKLRKMFNITGGFCDDFLSHLMCCCCALVQEWREVEIRGYDGDHNTKTTPPSFQYMES